jgi:hypothetical protein
LLDFMRAQARSGRVRSAPSIFAFFVFFVFFVVQSLLPAFRQYDRLECPTRPPAAPR